MYTGKSSIERAQLEILLEASEKLEIPELSQQCLQQLNNQPLAAGTTSLLDQENTAQNLSMKGKTLQERNCTRIVLIPLKLFFLLSIAIYGISKSFRYCVQTKSCSETERVI